MRGLIRRRPITSLALTAFVSLMIGVAIGQADEVDGDENDDPAPVAVDPEPEPEAEPAPEPDPDGRFSLTCDYLLGDFEEGTEQGYRFVAGGEVSNTGNIGIVTRVTATWSLLGSDPVEETERVRLRPGEDQNVQMTVLATQDQIDAHQSADGDCDAAAEIVDTFGQSE